MKLFILLIITILAIYGLGKTDAKKVSRPTPTPTPTNQYNPIPDDCMFQIDNGLINLSNLMAPNFTGSVYQSNETTEYYFNFCISNEFCNLFSSKNVSVCQKVQSPDSSGYYEYTLAYADSGIYTETKNGIKLFYSLDGERCSNTGSTVIYDFICNFNTRFFISNFKSSTDNCSTFFEVQSIYACSAVDF